MAFSTAFSTSFYTPQTSLFSSQKSNNLFPKTCSLFPSQAWKKLLCQPLRYNYNGFSTERSSCVGIVKAIQYENWFKNVEVFTKEHVAVLLAHDVAQHSNKFIREKGAFTVVLSGGSLIKYLRKLVEFPHAESIDWSKWHVFWVDERVVPKDHLESNYKLAYDGFLSKVPIPPVNIYTIDDALEADAAADVYETNLRRLVQSGVIATSSNGFPKFDLMLLSTGQDGHVGSLFPRHSLLKEDNKWVSFIKDSPEPPSDRITLTFPVINSSSNIAMVVTGAGKNNVVYSALCGDDKTDELPVGLVSSEGELTWYLDNGAASKLFKE